MTLGDIYSDTVTVTIVVGTEVIYTDELFSFIYFPCGVSHCKSIVNPQALNVGYVIDIL